MPRSSRNHNWNNQDRNTPITRTGIPDERRRLINRARGIEDTESNSGATQINDGNGIFQLTNLQRQVVERLEYRRPIGIDYSAFWMPMATGRHEMNINNNEVKKEMKDNRTYLDFKNGDLVRIRTWEDMETQFGVSCGDIRYSSKAYGYEYPSCRKEYIGKTFILKNYNSYGDWRKVIANKFYIDADKIELVESGYLDRINKERRALNGNRKVEKEISEKDRLKQDMIKKVDKIKMKKIIAGSLDLKLNEIMGVDKLLEDWAESKYEIYKILGENLKISKVIDEKMDGKLLGEKLTELKKNFPELFLYIEKFSSSEYLQNKIEYIPDYFKDYFEISEGMKLSKFFSKNFKNEKFDIELSKILQCKNIEGHIVISIDPIDYLLMSKNNSGWKSCHTIFDNDGSQGCYSAGIFSYMCDNATIIAYKHTSTLHKYNFNNYQIEEYSKNWRECLYYSNQTKAFVASRQYPFRNEEISKNVREMFEEKICEFYGINNKWKVIKDTSEIRSCMTDMSDLHYNDVLRYDETYRLCYNTDLDNLNDIKITVGSEAICPICGEHKLTEASNITCNDCEGY
jgi:hypothetical protein